MMLAAILFSFMIYGFYQPTILNALGFGGLASQWAIFQGLLGFAVEPAFGGLSDRILARTGSRLPQITVGVTVAGALFVLLSFALPLQQYALLQWPLLIMMTLWLIAMIAIRGPIVALLRQMAPDEQLPSANAIIILVLGLVAALGPLLEALLKTRSASVVFMLGAIALMLGATRLTQTAVLPVPTSVSDRGRLLRQYSGRLVWMVVVGLETGCLLNLALSTLPGLLNTSLPQLSPGSLTAISLFITALTANPWGWLTPRWGSAKALQLGLGAVAILCFLGSLGLASLSSIAAIGLLTATGAAMGLVFINMVPFALSYVPLPLTGLSAGLFFGGNGLGAALVLIWRQLSR
jgi:hypothetical protein